jgi:transposase
VDDEPAGSATRKPRTWDDLPWAEHPVTLRYALRRLWCRHCGIRTERVGFADPHARLTRRFRQRIGLDCQSMPTSHAALRHAVSWGTARRAERAFLEARDRVRPRRRPRHLGVDEIQRGKGQHFWTVLSDLVVSYKRTSGQLPEATSTGRALYGKLR